MTPAARSPATAPANAGAVVGIDAASTSTKAADELAQRVRQLLGGRVGPVIATHFIRGAGPPHVALSVEAGEDLTMLADLGALWTVDRSSGPGKLVRGAQQAAEAYRRGHGGRAVFFPGSDEVPDQVTVAELLAGTAIDAVEMLSGSDVDPAAVVLTRGHLRPTWIASRLVLAVERAAGGCLVPFETPNPTPCCAGHS